MNLKDKDNKLTLKKFKNFKFLYFKAEQMQSIE